MLTVLKFNAWIVTNLLHQIGETQTVLAEQNARGREGLTAEHINLSLTSIRKASETLAKLYNLQCTHNRVRDGGPFSSTLEFGATYPEARNELIVLRRCIEEDLRKLFLILIPSPKERVLKKLHVDWTQVWTQFPAVKYDSEQAIACYALNLNTACLFHLMRVTEFGLRGLAKRMNVKLPKNKPPDWPQWLGVLRRMKDKVAFIDKEMKAGPAKDELSAFYRGALGQFHEFQDEFRTHVIGMQPKYNDVKAARVVAQVKDFMNKLAFQIDERGKLIDWPLISLDKTTQYLRITGLQSSGMADANEQVKLIRPHC